MCKYIYINSLHIFFETNPSIYKKNNNNNKNINGSILTNYIFYSGPCASLLGSGKHRQYGFCTHPPTSEQGSPLQ